MIFITVGSQKFQMNRLLAGADTLIENGVIAEEVFAQTGRCTYVPKHYAHTVYMEKEEMSKKVFACSLMICHAGSGSMMMGIKLGKKVIAVPRKAMYGEHVDDHQAELAHTLSQTGYLLMAENVDDLKTQIARSAGFVPKPYVSCADAYVALLTEIIG